MMIEIEVLINSDTTHARHGDRQTLYAKAILYELLHSQPLKVLIDRVSVSWTRSKLRIFSRHLYFVD